MSDQQRLNNEKPKMDNIRIYVDNDVQRKSPLREVNNKKCLTDKNARNELWREICADMLQDSMAARYKSKSRERDDESKTVPSQCLDSQIDRHIGKEQWPNNVSLFQPYEAEQILLPQKANCLACQAFLRMCNLDFTIVPIANAEAMSPTRKVPLMKAGRFLIPEFDGITQFVGDKGIKTPTQQLSIDQIADMRAFMALMCNVFEIAEIFICWMDSETYHNVTSGRNGSMYPWPLNFIFNIIKRCYIMKKLYSLGWYNKSVGDVILELEIGCEALSRRLGNKDYFFDEGPTELDALVFGHLSAILTTPLPKNHLANVIAKFNNLLNFTEHIERNFFKKMQ